MTPAMLGFITGLIVGASLGILILGLLIMAKEAKRSDRDEQATQG